MNKASAYVNLVAQTSMCHLQKNMPTSSLEKWLKTNKQTKMAASRSEAGKIQVEPGKTVFYCALKKVMKESWRHVKTTQLEGALLVKSLHEPK